MISDLNKNGAEANSHSWQGLHNSDNRMHVPLHKSPLMCVVSYQKIYDATP